MPVSTEQTKRKADEARQDSKVTKRTRGTTAPERERDVGHALRSIYQRTVDESVPQEMLDLLGKLG